jgi:SAM-dependent methyltransferase
LYVKADLVIGQVNVRGDMTCMPFSAGAFDTLICCDVLEHIMDDRAAIAEIHRVLRPNGVAILTVPTFDDRDTTYEDPSVDTPDRRAVVYGQFDHVRNYGAGDLVAGLVSVGFTVSVVDAGCFSPELVRRHVLFPPTPRTSPHGWNNRRVFFARAGAGQLSKSAFRDARDRRGNQAARRAGLNPEDRRPTLVLVCDDCRVEVPCHCRP